MHVTAQKEKEFCGTTHPPQNYTGDDDTYRAYRTPCGLQAIVSLQAQMYEWFMNS